MIMRKSKMVWYEKYDFIENPFTIKPQETEDDFFGKKEIIRKVNSLVGKGKVVLIVGPYGTGKTTILKGIIDKFRGEKKVIYYNLYSGSDMAINFDTLLKNAGSVLSRFFRIKTKGVIMLIDEAHKMLKGDYYRLIDLYQQGYIRSIVLVSSDKGFRFPKVIRDLIDENKFELTFLDEKNAIKLVRSRLEGIKLLSDDMIKKILKKSESIRDFLLKCDDACRRAVERGSEKVEDEDLN
jgi:type II secretory pathway predicted ATPase ExeA